MTQLKHTPGPWFEHRDGFSTVYVEARISHGLIQEVAACGPTDGGPEQQSANARIIAASPELLESLILAKSVIKNMAEPSQSKSKVLEIIDAAISKATNVECLL